MKTCNRVRARSGKGKAPTPSVSFIEESVEYSATEDTQSVTSTATGAAHPSECSEALTSTVSFAEMRCPTALCLKEAVRSLTVSPRGDVCFVGHSEGIITAVDTTSGQTDFTLNGRNGNVTGIASSACLSRIFSTGTKGLTVFDTTEGAKYMIDATPADAVHTADCGEACFVVVRSKASSLTVYDVDGVVLSTLKHKNLAPKGVAFSACRQWMVTCGGDTIRVWDLVALRCENVIAMKGVVSVGVSPCSKFIVAADAGQILLVKDGGLVATRFKVGGGGRALPVLSIRFSPCGGWLYSQHAGKVNKWEFATGDVCSIVANHYTLSPCARWLLSVDDEENMLRIL